MERSFLAMVGQSHSEPETPFIPELYAKNISRMCHSSVG